MNYIVHGILQTRILEWVAFPFLRDLPNLRIQPKSPALQADSLPAEPQEKLKNTGVGSLSLLQEISPTQELNQVSCIAGRFFTNWAIRDHNKLWKILSDGKTSPPYLPPEKSVCRSRSTVRTKHGTKTDWFQIGKGICHDCILSPCLFNLNAEYIMWNAQLDEAQAGIKIARWEKYQ